MVLPTTFSHLIQLQAKVLMFLSFFYFSSPVIVLKDTKKPHLEALLNYMYIGEVDIRRDEFDEIVKTAENLCIKGLGVPDEGTMDGITENRKKVLENSSDNIKNAYKDINKMIKDNCNSPLSPNKRQRTEDSEDNATNNESLNSNSVPYDGFSLKLAPRTTRKSYVEPDENEDFNQITVEPDIQVPSPLMEDEREQATCVDVKNDQKRSWSHNRGLLCVKSPRKLMAKRSSFKGNSFPRDFSMINQYESDKQKHNNNEGQLNSSLYMDAGPSGIQWVSRPIFSLCIYIHTHTHTYIHTDD